MADEYDLKKKYDYKSNSNLVLQVNYDYTERRRKNDPTGEVMPLTAEQLASSRMGDKYIRTGVPDEKRNKETKKEKGESISKNINKHVSIADADLSGVYLPKSKESKSAYDSLITILYETLGDQPREILCGAADEVLRVLKSSKIHEKNKKKEIDDLLGVISDELMNQLSNLSKKINDFVMDDDDNKAKVDDLDEREGVNVNFSDSEEEEDDYNEIENDSSGESEGGEEADVDKVLEGDSEVDLNKETKGQSLKAIDIDAYWIQRELEKFYPVKEVAQEKRKLTIDILRHSKDIREVESELVNLLDYECFELIKKLRDNWKLILYCTLWKSAEKGEKEELEKEMKSNPELSVILDDIEGKLSDNADSKTVKKKKEINDLEGNSMMMTRRMLNLDELTFAHGGHFMGNKKCILPDGSSRKVHKDFESVFVPAQKPKPLEKGEKLIKISDLPKWSQQAFDGFKALNRIQSKLMPTALKSDEPMLVCAPTGAGKTNVALMCILREVSKHMNSDGTIRLDEFKCIYIAPMRSLVQEMVGSFSKRLESYGLVVGEMTGDSNMTKEQFMETQIIVCTPEKYDVVTRKGGDRSYSSLVKLIIIDEIHLLHDDRGPVLEAIVMRTLREIISTNEDCRLVGLSATLPNYEDVAAFLRVEPKNLFYFDNSYRPVPLEQEYIGITAKKGLKKYQTQNEVLYEKVLENAGQNQVLIFVHSRKETARTAKALRDMFVEKGSLSKIIQDGSASSEILRSEGEQIKNPDLKDLLQFGFGIHHAGMNRIDRTTVEDLFGDKHLPILVSTATLAWGVNLPAHTVIIKGTQVYNPEKGCWTELSSMDVMQMMGRAGRPQYDTTGMGIMITNHSELQYYLSLLNQQLLVESQLISKLPELLNAEIVLGTINNVNDAVNWLGYSYLYIRMMKAPGTYGIDFDEFESDPLLNSRRADLIHTACMQLERGHLIQYDKKSGYIKSTNLGRIASHYYCTYQTMQTYNQLLKPTCGDIDIFRIFSLSSEFKNINVREEEKLELQKLAELVPIPIKESLEDPTSKVNILLQTYISQLQLDGFAIIADMIYISQSATRLFRAMFEIVCYRGWAALAQKILACYKMVMQRQWQSLNPLHQFKRIPTEIIRNIDKRNYSFERLYDLDYYQLGELVKQPKIGKSLYKYIRMVPKLNVSTLIQPITRSSLRFEIIIKAEFNWDEKTHGKSQGFWIFIEDVNGEDILHHEYFLLKQKYCQDEHVVKMIIPVYDPMPPLCYVRVVSDQYIGSETLLPVSFKSLILPEKCYPPTELYDLQPQVVEALSNPEYEDVLKRKGIKIFNPIQTQCFRPCYETNDNLFIGAPYGSGKGVLAELCLLRHFSQNPDFKAVYICPVNALTKKVYNDWKLRIEKNLGMEIVLLTGDPTTDLKLLQKGNVIVSNAEHWDSISRRWRQRKNIQAVRLFMVSDIHTIGSEGGSTLEVVCSRMRFMNSQLTGGNIRFVAFSTSVLNSRDFGGWLGVSAQNTFNFGPSSRPVPLEIQIKSFNISHTPSRLDAMVRPVYSAIVNQAGNISGKPVIVFVPSRRQTNPTAMDLITAAHSDGKSTKFLHIPSDDEVFVAMINKLSDQNLKETIEFGIGHLHEGTTEKDKNIVEKLFMSGAIQVVIVSRTLCYEINISSYLVIIMDTVYYNGQYHTYEDYSMTELLYMVGLANQPEKFSDSKCVLMCQNSKKSYYLKFLNDMLPVESHLDHCLHDHFNAEIVTKTIENKQDAIDFITWTFLYRRLPKNPNYYNLKGTSNSHISDSLSDLVENTLNMLEQAKCIQIIDEYYVSPLNLGMIAAYFYISFTTVEVFNLSIKEKTKVRGILEIISNSTEFGNIIIRYREVNVLKQLCDKLPNQLKSQKFNDPRIKTNLLLNAYLNRLSLSAELNKDINDIVPIATRLAHACVDVITSNAWLKPAIAAMELAQMLTQAVNPSDHYLKQLPHSTQELIERAKEMGINSVFDLLEMEDDDRNKLLQMDRSKLNDVAQFCNYYPSIEISYDISEKSPIVGDTVSVDVTMERDNDIDGLAPPVVAPFYPATRKDEGWWLVIGEPESNTILAVKRVTVHASAKVKLDFIAPSPGKHDLKLYFICDSYLGADQEFDFKIHSTPDSMNGDEVEAKRPKIDSD
uniref:U5 small nuclear ribonucleoprotein 200 kDa helicase n=1 Tax=Strongyloides papillosus TaxID=174720 RepID=A0A0N5BBZ1_STREA